jgi:phage baseplate assembly protein W
MSTASSFPREPVGWPLLPLPDAHGCLSYPALADSVRQSLRVLLSTRPGEQLMHPGFGAGLTGFLGAPDTITTRRRIHDRVTESIGRWEPRITLDRVDLAPAPDQPGHLHVTIAYRLRRTGAAGTLGVNLQLET